jgi:hypothetical protein
MPDVFATIVEAPPKALEMIAGVLELRRRFFIPW